jgi:hypothetical protein
LSGEKVLKFNVCALFEHCYHGVKAFERCRLLFFNKKKIQPLALFENCYHCVKAFVRCRLLNFFKKRKEHLLERYFDSTATAPVSYLFFLDDIVLMTKRGFFFERILDMDADRAHAHTHIQHTHTHTHTHLRLCTRT